MSPSTQGPLAGKVALVTGGASGIGKACAERYRAEGATVIVADLHPTSSDEVQLDVADPAAWAALVAQLPPLDIVHLNAGIVTPGLSRDEPPEAPLADVTDEAYRAIMGANLDGVFLGARAVLPGMVERGEGHVLVTASLAGLGAMPGDIAYTTTKHAVVGFVKSLGATLERQGHPGVCASALCPGFIHTPLVPEDRHEFIRAMGAPIAPPSQVAEAAMQALAARANGSIWTIWGDSIRHYQPPALELE